MQQSIYSHFIFKVETKTTEEEFEAYDPDWLFLRVFNWADLDEESRNDEEFVFQLQDVDKSPFKMVRINPK
jgi:hypothetical protein